MVFGYFLQDPGGRNSANSAVRVDFFGASDGGIRGAGSGQKAVFQAPPSVFSVKLAFQN
jgi:hypothetical protein